MALWAPDTKKKKRHKEKGTYNWSSLELLPIVFSASNLEREKCHLRTRTPRLVLGSFGVSISEIIIEVSGLSTWRRLLPLKVLHWTTMNLPQCWPDLSWQGYSVSIPLLILFPLCHNVFKTSGLFELKKTFPPPPQHTTHRCCQCSKQQPASHKFSTVAIVVQKHVWKNQYSSSWFMPQWERNPDSNTSQWRHQLSPRIIPPVPSLMSASSMPTSPSMRQALWGSENVLSWQKRSKHAHRSSWWFRRGNPTQSQRLLLQIPWFHALMVPSVSTTRDDFLQVRIQDFAWRAPNSKCHSLGGDQHRKDNNGTRLLYKSCWSFGGDKKTRLKFCSNYFVFRN